jgi:hypothetical protein
MAKKKKLKFKIIHLFIFAIILFVICLSISYKGDLKIDLTRGNRNQDTAIDEKERIEISGVKVADFISRETNLFINQIGQGKSPSYYTLAQTPDYHIFYIQADELFFISITSYPFDEYRPVAEQKLLEVLEISEDDACKLNVDITTPAYANPDKTGEVYGLSWCE